MNKKVFISMLSLVVAFLLSLYILKIFFPENFILTIENENLIKIGMFIDSHILFKYLFGIFTSFITYSLYCSAVSKKWVLSVKQYLIILIVIGINIGLSFVDLSIYQHFNICSMIVLPLLFGAELKPVAIVYSIHGLSQILSLSIRNLPMYMTNVNALTRHIVGIECWLWLVLFYLIYNYKKKEV